MERVTRRRLLVTAAALGALAIGAVAGVRLWQRSLERRAEHHVHLGMALLENGYIDPTYFPQARAEFEAALDALPGSVEAEHDRALALFCLGELDAAADAFERIVDADAQNRPARFALARVEIERERWPPAHEHLRRLWDDGERSPALRHHYARALEAVGDFDAVLELLDAGAHGPLVFSGDYWLRVRTLGALGLAGERRVAIEEYTLARERLPQQPFAPGRRFERYLDVPPALRPIAVPRALRRGSEPEYVDVSAERGVAVRHGGRPDDADLARVLAGESIARAWFDERANRERLVRALAAGVAVLDYDRDGRLDIFVVGVDGGHVLLRQETSGRFTDVTAAAGIVPRLRVATSCASGDYDNDGWPDLLVTGLGELRLLRNTGVGFEDVSEESGIAAGVSAESCLLGAALVDFDFEGDLDLWIAGFVDLARPKDEASGATLRFPADFRAEPDRLLCNLGGSRFVDAASESGLGGAGKRTIGALFTHLDDDGIIDALVFAHAGPPRALRNLRDGTFEAFDAKWLDAHASDIAALAPAPILGVATAYGDLDRDGWSDRVVVESGGTLRIERRATPRGNWLVVRLLGRKQAGNDLSNRSGIGGLVEARAVGLWTRATLAAGNGRLGCDAAEVYLELGDVETLDYVQGFFPSGVRWSLTEVPVRQIVTIEEPALPGNSCPLLFAWSGARFELVTDTISAGILGEQIAPGVYWQPDPDEWLRIDGRQLVAREEPTRDGTQRWLELRLVNALEEVTFLDRARLLAIDHPGDVEVHPNESMSSDPSRRRPARLHALGRLRPLRRAIDSAGRDVTAWLAENDRRSAGPVELLGLKGFAREWTLTLELPDARDGPRDVLVLDGWTAWNSSASALAAAQAGIELAPPSLEVEARDGSWRVVDDDIGVFAGLPRSILVDLRGKLADDEYRVRIRSARTLSIDRVRVAENIGEWPTGATPSVAGIASSERRLAHAELRWLGYPERTLPGGMLPEVPDYDTIAPTAPWGTHVGFLTRYGRVTPLVESVDDRFVVMGHGEEVVLRFAAHPDDDARDVAGDTPRRRTWLFFAHGYEKGFEPHSAHHRTVEPLPFAAMSGYPYDATRERYPTSDAHLEYVAEWNTRPSWRRGSTCDR